MWPSPTASRGRESIPVGTARVGKAKGAGLAGGGLMCPSPTVSRGRKSRATTGAGWGIRAEKARGSITGVCVNIRTGTGEERYEPLVRGADPRKQRKKITASRALTPSAVWTGSRMRVTRVAIMDQATVQTIFALFRRSISRGLLILKRGSSADAVCGEEWEEIALMIAP